MRPINPVWPGAEVRDIDQLMDIAVAMEREAAERYEQLAAAMARRNEAELAQLFGELAQLERQHESGLGRWTEREGRRPAAPQAFAWQMPETFGDEAEGAEAHVLTPYRALGIAVRNEERAFSFYAYLAAQAEAPEVRRRAEALAREELNHVAQLRALRRRAYHTERGEPRRRAPRSRAEFAAMAYGLERASAELDRALSAVAADAGDGGTAALLRRVADEAAARSQRLPASPEAPGSEAAEAARRAGLAQPGLLTVFGALRLSLRNAEQVLDAYMAAAENAADEAMLGEAQALSGEALARLALVRSQLAETGD